MGSSVLDRVRSHAQPDAVRRLEVPEWGEDGKPLIIHYRMMTLDDMAVVNELDGPAWHKQAARIVVLKALDESGAPLFKMSDATALREGAAPDVVTRVALSILGRLSVEQAEKN
jgi:hypothetical protein